MATRLLTTVLLGATALALPATAASAANLVLNYSVSNNPNATYHYDFELKLTNGDGTWVSGQQWDWIIFGDRAGSYTASSGFCPSGCGASQFTNFTSPDANAALTNSSGGHQGPTIAYGANSVTLPGWQPTAVGSTLQWSGDSPTLLGQSQLYWSALVTSSGAQRPDFWLANMVGAPVPEPSTWAMMLLGFGALGMTMRGRTNSQTMRIRFA